MAKVILFLDDDPTRAALAYQRWPSEKRDRTIWVKTVEETIDIFRNYDVEEAHLDHDLGGERYVHSERDDCGMEVVRWIQENRDQVKDIVFIVHSWNIPAGIEMLQRLIDIDLKATYTPFGL